VAKSHFWIIATSRGTGKVE